MTPDIDRWLPSPGLRVTHRRSSRATQAELWRAAREVKLSDTSLLGRLVRWRIPGTHAELPFDELLRNPPFLVLDEDPRQPMLISGLVGRIWTLRRDYPLLEDPEQFLGWSRRGTAKVVFANWIEIGDDDKYALVIEARVQALGHQGRLGVAAVKPLVNAFHPLLGSEGLEAAVRHAERRGTQGDPPGAPTLQRRR